MTTALRDIGPVLVKVADDYAATDQAPRDAFNGLSTRWPRRRTTTQPR